MAVAYDSAVAGTGVTSASSLTFSFTNSAGDAMAVGVGTEWFGVTVSGITYNGTAMTQQYNAGHNTYFGHAGFTLLSPATGAHDVVVTMTGTTDRIQAGAISVSGAGSVGNVATATGSSTSATVDVASATGNMVVGLQACRTSDNWTVGAGQTERYRDVSSNFICMGSTEAGASTVTTSWDETFTGGPWGIGAIEFVASGGGGTTRGNPFNIGNAFNGGRTFAGIIR